MSKKQEITDANIEKLKKEFEKTLCTKYSKNYMEKNNLVKETLLKNH